MQSTHKLWLAASAIFAITAIAAALSYIRMQQDADFRITAVATPDAPCELQQGPCSARFSDGSRITLSVQPLPIQGLKPLQIKVTAEGLSARAVDVDFQGLGMNMGYNRPQLEMESEDSFSGSGMLSVCVLERMHWEATVLATTDQGVLAAPFRFETVRP